MTELQTELMLTPEQVELVIGTWLGGDVQCTGIERLHGGMINSVLRLSFDREPYTAVIKLNRAGRSDARRSDAVRVDLGSVAAGDTQVTRPEAGGRFEHEARALRYLYERGFPCPAVYAEDSQPSLLPYTYLLLETLPGANLTQVPLDRADRARVERELAEVLADLHAQTRATFGPIDGPGEAKWVDVFMPQLLQVRSEPEVSQRLPAEVLRDVDRSIEVAPELLADQGTPTLIHGDIWAANVIVRPSLRRVSRMSTTGWALSGLVDPGAQYADVEMELAYLRVFETVGKTFFDIYTAYNPLRPGYRLRSLVYWLRTYLIHVWLFGDQRYRDMTARVAEEIVARAV